MADKKVDIKQVFGNVNIGKFGVAKRSYLGKLIVAFSDFASQEEYEEEGIEIPFEIEDKITHNSVVQYAYLFEEYVAKEKALRDIYSNILEVHPFARRHILRSVKREYKKWKGYLIANNDFDEEIDLVRENSDFLIGKVIEDVKGKLIGNTDIKEVDEELLSECVDLVISDAFVECKILENPNK